MNGEKTAELIFLVMYEKAKVPYWKHKVLTNKEISFFAKATIILDINRIARDLTELLIEIMEKYERGY